MHIYSLIKIDTSLRMAGRNDATRRAAPLPSFVREFRHRRVAMEIRIDEYVSARDTREGRQRENRNSRIQRLC